MQQKTICMFVYNTFNPDIRVLKEAKSLINLGFQVTIFAVHAEGMPHEEIIDGVKVVRIIRNPIHYRLLKHIRNNTLLKLVVKLLVSIMGLILLPFKLAAKAISSNKLKSKKNAQEIEDKKSIIKQIFRSLTSSKLFRNLTKPLQFVWRKVLRKGYYLFIRKPVRFIWYRLIRRGYFLFIRKPARFIWYRLIRKGYYLFIRRPLRFIWYRLIRKGYYLLIRRPVRFVWYRLIRKGFYLYIRRPYRIVWHRYIKKFINRFISRPINRFFYENMRKVLLKFHKPLSFLDYYFRSYKEAREYNADVFHAHDLNTLPVAWYLKKKLGGKLVYDSHELYTETSTITGFEKKISKFVENKLIKKCDHVITVCDSIANELVQRYSINSPTVIMNCPEINEYVEQQDLIRTIVPIEKNTPIILYQGGYAPNRGLETLIEASRYFRVGKLVMMGWGRIEQKLKDYVERENLSDTVYFIPPAPQDELLYWSASADLGVIPYQAVGLNNYYSCPNKLFEYIAAGIPVAGSAFPEISKVINGNKLGLTFDPHDSKSIAEAVNTMLSDENAFIRMKNNARIARKKLNWSTESVKLNNVYSHM